MDLISETLCPGCFTDPVHTNPCPHCGYARGAERPPLMLPLGIRLLGHYRIGRVLGKPGGFGITYLAWDQGLHRRVAIKEYLPRDLAGRGTDRLTLVAHGSEDGDLLRYGLEQFLGEARTLAQLDHPNIVRVHQVFEANGTAYLVMEYYAGFTLAEHLERQGGRLPEDQARALMMPILDGLRAVHAKGFLHRDVKPQNIYLARTEGGVRPILLDFGAARLAMGERSRSLSVVLTPGFAPFEQYHRKGKQGPWTDIYGASAVLYQLVTGETPPEANERMAGDDLKPAAGFGVSRPLSEALTTGLALAPDGRPQTVREFQALLGVGTVPTPKPAAAVAASAPVSAPPPVRSAATADTPTPRGWPLVLGVFGVSFLVIAAAALYEAKLKTEREREVARQKHEQFEQAKAAWVAKAPGAADALPAMVSIPGGRFLMGSPEGEPERMKTEGPQHWVQIAPFELGKYEVTYDQWEACHNDGVCKSDWRVDQGIVGFGHPVISVSWQDAQDYLGWLSRKTGKAYRLPTEAEWEYAARAGTVTPFSTGSCITTTQANYNGSYDYNQCGANTGVNLGKVQPIGSYPANPWGLHDMHGNIWEWVEDCWNADYRRAPNDGSAWRQPSCAVRVLRGGAFDNYPTSLRSANRGSAASETRTSTVGFRVARDLTP